MSHGPPARNGRVVTFYSYKGGTGRSMALANLAWILAAAGRRVLMIDWDLEAPGLHRWFRPFLIDHELTASDGLIDLIDRYATEAIGPSPEGGAAAADWWLPLTDFSEHVLSIDFAGFPSGGKIDLLPAGRQGDTYALKVSAFNWQNFYDRLGGGGFLEAVRARAQGLYDYILIDSRTGVSDTSGICTAQMPDTLVVGFTYNNQSIRGAAAVAASARKLHAKLAEERRQRRAAAGAAAVLEDSPRPLRVYPVPMRVDAGESERLALRQAFARDAFQSLLEPMNAAEVSAYWSAVEVPHRVLYAYEEVLAPFQDDAQDPKTVLAAFLRLAQHVTEGDVGDYRLPLAPEQRRRFLDAFADTPQTAEARERRAQEARESEEQAKVRAADEAILSLTEAQRERARSILCRLIRVVRDEEGGGLYPIRVALDEIDEPDREVLALLEQRSLVSINTESRSPMPTAPAKGAAPGQRTVALDGTLFSQWTTLKRWIDEDREFLLWRQQLRDYRNDWARSGDRSSLLFDSLLFEARQWLRTRAGDLNSREHEFITRSVEGVEPAPAVRSVELARTVSLDAPVLAEARGHASKDALLDAPPSGHRWLAVAAVLLLASALGYYFLPTRQAPPLTASVDPPASAPQIVLPSLPQLMGEADALYADGRLAEAATAYRRVLAVEPNSIGALLQLGRVQDRNGDFAGSAASYEAAIRAAPNDPQPYIERAASLSQQQRLDAALADLDRALQNDPRNAVAYYNRGAAKENLGRTKEAIEDYSEAIRWRQDFAAAYLQRARLYEAGNRPAAIADYQSVLRLPADEASINTAQERLKVLGRASPPKQPTSGAPRVAIQFSDGADAARAEALRSALAGAFAKKAVLLPVEKTSVQSNGETRYFFEADRALAESVSSEAEAALSRMGFRQPLKVTFRSAREYPTARPGLVELWLPRLSQAPFTRGLRTSESPLLPRTVEPAGVGLELYTCESNPAASRSRADRFEKALAASGNVPVTRRSYPGQHAAELMRDQGGYFVVRYLPQSGGEKLALSIVQSKATAEIAPWSLSPAPQQVPNTVAVFVCVATS